MILIPNLSLHELMLMLTVMNFVFCTTLYFRVRSDEHGDGTIVMTWLNWEVLVKHLII